MQINKANENYKVRDMIQSHNERYQILQRINDNKKITNQMTSTQYEHMDTFIVKKQSNKLYYIMKRYVLTYFDKLLIKQSNTKQSSSNSPSKEKGFIKELNNKILHHPNLIQIQEIFLQAKQNSQKCKYLYLVEEYCEEGDLAYFIKYQNKKYLKQYKQSKQSRQGRQSKQSRQGKQNKKQYFSQKIISKWLLQILLALQYLHYNKLTHQLLNPLNIYLTPLGNLKINQYYLLNSINFIKQNKEFKKNKQSPNIILDGYQPMLNQKKFKINQKKDINDFGNLIFYLCHAKEQKQSKKQTKSKNINHLPSFYSQDLDNIYLNCVNVKKTAIQVKDILKTPYFLEVMRSFINDKKLNIPLFDKIPIKKYTIHKKTLSPKTFKKIKKLQDQKNKNEINEKNHQNKLPKIHKIQKSQQNKKSYRKIDSRQQKAQSQVDLKKAMRASLQKLKNKLEIKDKQRLSRQKKIRKNSIDKSKQEKIIQNKNNNEKIQKPKVLTPISSSKGSVKNSLLPPPPTLLKNKKNDSKTRQQTQQSQKNGTKSSREQARSRQSKSRQKNKKQNITRSQSNSPNKQKDKLNEFKLTPDITFGKKSIPTQHTFNPIINLKQVNSSSEQISPSIQSKQSELAKISQNLAKIFSDLKIRQDDDEQLSFELDGQEQEQLRLTLKQEKQSILNEDNLMKTYKGKFDQIISQLQQKYQPNLQIIIQKTNQWDSNDFFTNKQLLKKLQLSEGGSLLPSEAFIQEDINNQYCKNQQD